MRRAAGIILITIGVLTLWGVATVLHGVVSGVVTDMFIMAFARFSLYGELPLTVGLICLFVPAAVHIGGGIFCLRRKYWRVCLASAWSVVTFSMLFPILYEYLWVWIIDAPMGWIYLVVLIADAVSVVFISLTRAEWQEISDSVGGEVSYDG